MISCKAISSSGGAAKYFYEKNGQQTVQDGRAEYYQKDEVRTAWGGKAAEIFKGENGKPVGEGNPVDKADLVKALDGRIQDADGTERTLGKWGKDENGEKTWEHRAGVDFTFSAPKSLSIGSEVFGNEDFRRAHERGVNAAMAFLEKHAATTRINGETVNTGNLLYAKVEHSISRELDPQTHTHVLISNMTYHAESGKFYSVANENLLDLRAAADAVYKNEAAAELQGDGYRLEFEKGGNWEVAQYTKEQIEHFSTRSEQIKDELGKSGRLDENGKPLTWDSKEVAFQKTRAAKTAPDNAEAQRDAWQERAHALGAAAPVAVKEETIVNLGMNGREAVSAAMSHLTERESAFSTKDLYKSASTFAHGAATYEQIERSVDRAIRTGDLIQREDGKYTTREMVDAEKHMGDRLEAGKGQHEAVMTRQEFDAALSKFEERKGFSLTPEQRQAAKDILVGNGDGAADKFQGVQGLAGTGKTTMLEFVRESAESKGWTVKGFSNGAEQAQKMEQESGIKSTTTARHLIETDKSSKDAQLAQGALKTYEKHQNSLFGSKPDFDALKKGVANGSVTHERDSAGRDYFTKLGKTYTPGLYQDKDRTVSANVNHAGATKTDYVEVKDKGVMGLMGGTHVMKRGGTLASEGASKLHDKIHEGANGGGLGTRVVAGTAGQILSKAENWQKAGPLEGLAARAQMKAESIAEKRDLVADLKQQAAGVVGVTNVKELRIMDEASMSGQKEFNKVINATEKDGARAVFLGDKLQHQGVEAGRAFEKAQDHMHTSRLDRESIRRQTTDHAKEAVNKVLDGKHGEAVTGLKTTEIRTAQGEAQAKWEKRESSGKPLNAAEKAEKRADMKAAAIEDNKGVIAQLSKDYAALTPQQQRETLVITATNADKQAINEGVRAELKTSGQLQDGKAASMLTKSDATETQLKSALGYQKGETVVFQKDYKNLDVARGERGEVMKTDAQFNTVTIKLESGREITAQPAKQQMQTYNKSEREFSAGDRVRMEKNETNKRDGIDVRNGQTGTVEKFDGKTMDIKLDNGKNITIDTEKYQHINHAYATTSHSAQGQTVKEAWMHHNTESGRHGDREVYVNVTRAKEDVKVYTQNVEKAEKQAGTVLNKEAAIEKTADQAQQKGADQDIQQTTDKQAGTDKQQNQTAESTKTADQDTGKGADQAADKAQGHGDGKGAEAQAQREDGRESAKTAEKTASPDKSADADASKSSSKADTKQAETKIESSKASDSGSKSESKSNSSSLLDKVTGSSKSSSKSSDSGSSSKSESKSSKSESKATNERESNTVGSGRGSSGGGRGGGR